MKNLTLKGIALLAVLSLVVSAIVCPVFAAAKQNPPSTAYNLSKIGGAAGQYAVDYDGGTVLTQQGDQGFDRPWPILLHPYLDATGSVQSLFFDPTRPTITGNKAKIGPSDVLWSSLTSLSINDSGYTGVWSTIGGKCTGRKLGYRYGGKKLSEMEFPAQRVAFAPTIYDSLKGHEGYGWTMFHSYDAPFPKPAIAAELFSWNNMVYGTRKFYKDQAIPVVRADGSAASLYPKDFSLTASTLAQQCAFLDAGAAKTWGKYWLAN